MKADPTGTPAEKARAMMGWMTATQSRIAGVPSDARCSTCFNAAWRRGQRGDGGISITIACAHRDAAGANGHATRETAVCRFWSRKS